MSEHEITLTIPVRLVAALEYLLDRGRAAAEREGHDILSPLIFDRTQAVRESIERQINHALAAGPRKTKKFQNQNMGDKPGRTHHP